MDWLIFWTALGTAVLVTTAIGSLFGYIRNNDMKTLTGRLDSIENGLSKRLLEDEFRRHEKREDEIFRELRESHDSKFEKLDKKIDEKFDKLFDILMNKE